MRNLVYLSALAATVSVMAPAVAAKDYNSRSFATLSFSGDPMEGRLDPIVNKGQPSLHVHSIMAPENFNVNSTGQELAQAKCTKANVKGDMSAYWMPKVYFHDKKTNVFEPVPVYYMKVYYFFEATDDKIEAFPLGLQMVAGDATLRSPPKSKGTSNWKIVNGVEPQPASFTCPRKAETIQKHPEAWPKNSDGTKGGFPGPDPGNSGVGVGFPFADCDGLYSPLRADVHFPSCYNPAKGLTNWKENMVFPTAVGFKENCPKGFKHVPHLFFEVYWDTAKFKDRWTPYQGEQPFVLANGDRTGFSLHADFMSGWDEKLLQNIIDNCNAGHAGLHSCPGATQNTEKCDVQSKQAFTEEISGKLQQLPGNNPVFGWGVEAPSSSGNENTTPNQETEEPKPASTTNEELSQALPTIEVQLPAKEALAPQVTSPPVEEKEQQPTPILTSKVIQTTDAAGQPTQVVVWETVTQWVTKTVYQGMEAKPTQSPKVQQQRISQQQSKDSAGGWAAAGCYRDTRDRVLQGDMLPSLGPMSNLKCIEHCSNSGFTVAGTQYGDECFCGNSFTGTMEKIADTECSMNCRGDASAKCGGDWALSVFTQDVSQLHKKSVEVNNKNKRHLHNHMLHHRNSNKQHFHPRRR